MRRRVTGLLLWCGLLLAVGTVRMLERALRMVVWLRFREAVAVIGLIVVATTSNLVSARVQESASGPGGHMVVLVGVLLIGAAVVYHGLRSSIRPRLNGRERHLSREPRASRVSRLLRVGRYASGREPTIRRS